MTQQEDEARAKILQALTISPRLTFGMLQAHLSSRIKNSTRNAVLARMAGRGEVRIKELQLTSHRGKRSVVKVVELADTQTEAA